MRLHHIAELHYPNEVKERFFGGLGRPVQFYFGDIFDIPDEEWLDLESYAKELTAAGLFRLPFPCVSYAFERHGRHVVSHVKQMGPKTFDFYVAVKQEIDGHPGLAALKAVATIHDVTEKGVNMEVPRASMGFWPEANTAERSKEAQAELGDFVNCLFALTVMMHAKGIEVSTEPAPEKLNAKRAKKGKPPIEDIRHVTIRVDGKRYSITGHEIGHHASPRLHWRRGHIRHLPSGVITNVRPCLVGTAERGVVDHDYAVKRKA